ncbi:methylated-DNA--[protein]-cysteine S-methyltransferase [Azospirillum halopraeferens]|uniref:methylated-DNA--[protein]-cysteine S-methyltransferase n=1 Tax=Azospirillum halopraeferens TaxID=34010 RepID=UPI0004197508|nr:methylated-DNA--[protein]-cysteine S-methyltransferase [Azospirillum halopraeferens]
MGSLTIASPLGPLLLTSAGGALVSLDWVSLDRGTGPTGPAEDPEPLLDEAAAQLADYFAGRRTVFRLPLAPRGTPFRKRVWEAMSEIPYGRVASYGDLARALGTAARAVGGACGRNPLPIIIPCHRVVAGSGPGGYSGFGGLDTKAWLLNHERTTVPVTV